MNALARYIPALEWLPKYEKANLSGDIAAGLTTAIMLIPQAMAYAMLAGLPPEVGLYSSVLPLILYAVFGTSRQLAVGPVAMVSLLVASGVAPLAGGDMSQYIAFAVTLSLMVGVFQLAMGVFRLGFLVNFLSHPVVSGFTSAAALIIGLSQFKHLLGINLPRSKHIHTILLGAIERAGEINGITVGIGLASIVILVVLKKVNPRFPRALVVVLFGTLLVWGLGLDKQGVKIVGDVPAGLPPLALPSITFDALKSLLPTALTISLVGFMESISVAKAFAKKGKYEVIPNQELIGLGVANIGGALTGAYPVTGGFSRTAVNAQAGSKTTLASMLTAAIIGVTLLFFTPLFHYLPKAVLAAIIMTAVFGLIDIDEVKHLWKVKRADLAMLGLTFVATLTLGIEEGILLGAGASMAWMMFTTTTPHTAVLGRLPGTNAFRNVKNHPTAETTPGVLMVRIDAQFYYGNVTFLKDTLKGLIADAAQPVHTVILEAASVNQLDSSAATALEEVLEELTDKDIRLCMANVKQPVKAVMDRAHFTDKLGEDQLFLDMDAALKSATHPRATPAAA